MTTPIKELIACFEETGPKLTVPEILERLRVIDGVLAEQPAQPKQEPETCANCKHCVYPYRNCDACTVQFDDPTTSNWEPKNEQPAQRKPLTDEQEREAFEAHWYSFYHSGSVSARSDGSYMHPHVQRAWEAWQARAAQE